jgi:hypothetical protein
MNNIFITNKRLQTKIISCECIKESVKNGNTFVESESIMCLIFVTERK